MTRSMRQFLFDQSPSEEQPHLEGNPHHRTEVGGFTQLLLVLLPFRMGLAKRFERRYHEHHYIFVGQVYYPCPFSFLSPFSCCLPHTGILPQALDTPVLNLLRILLELFH
jgi:hypothetical protein